MAEITLKVESGRPLGTRPSGRLRTAGKIPGVVYGHGMAPIPVAIGARDLRAALTTEAGLNALLSLKIGDTTHLAIAKVLQRHPVRQTVTHVDFQVVRRDEIVTAEVRIALVGESEAVHRVEGTIDQEMLSLQIKAKPGDVPVVIEVDVSALEVGDSLRVSDLVLPEGVTTDVDPEAAVAIAHRPTRSRARARGRGSRGSRRRRTASRFRRRLRAGKLFRGIRAVRSRAGRGPRARGHRRPARGRAGQPGCRVPGDPAQRRGRGGAARRAAPLENLRAERGSSAETAVVRIGGKTLASGGPPDLRERVRHRRAGPRTAVPRRRGGARAPERAVAAAARSSSPPGSLVIVHDELDLEPGVVRVKLGGGTAGHNGLRSIQSHLHHLDFVRVRIGVGKPPSPVQGRTTC